MRIHVEHSVWEYESSEGAVTPAGGLAVTAALVRCLPMRKHAALLNSLFLQFLVGQKYYSSVTIRLEVIARVPLES